MSSTSPRERLVRVLQKKSIDRPPVICTGGMMNAAIVDVMETTGHTLPAGHGDAGLMAEIATDVHRATGFENIGIPFCMTVEAEVLGSEINFGSLECEPKIEREPFPSVRQVEFRDISGMLKSGRIGTVVEAANNLSRRHPDQPVIGSLTGPISTAAAIVDPVTFLKELRKDPEGAHRVLSYVSDLLVAFAQELVDNGATLIAIGDPTATGEILGPRIFGDFAVPYLNRVIDAVHGMGAPVIVHICGKLQAVKGSIPLIRGDAISTDALVNLKLLKEEFPQLVTMGNVSTFLLEMGEADKVARQTGQLVRDGVDIIAPACGLSTSSRLENIQAMTGVVKS
ncbi:MAG: methylcobamide--CoM methyltransferase [Geobacter sp.]|nr:methylcobamide--CoM methyltransferase [Geobacter sp.]